MQNNKIENNENARNKIENSENANNITLKENSKKHNGIIGFWKFIFSLIIIIYHLNQTINVDNTIFKYGYIGVEFFFLVSGYLLAKKALNKKDSELSTGEETKDFIWKKIKNFFPYMFVSFVICFFMSSWAVKEYSKIEIANSIWNLFFLETSGIRFTAILTQTWYISAMLISMLILYPLLRKYKKNFIYIIAPIIVILVGGWISFKYGTLNGWEHTGLVYKCLLRAIFEISLGTILYEIGEKIKLIKFTTFSKILLSIVEIGGFISVILLANSNELNLELDYIMLLILSISVTIAFSEKTLFYNISCNKLMRYLEKLSLPIYLNHSWVVIVINKIFNNISYSLRIFTTIILTIVFSIIITFIIEKIKNSKKLTSRIKKCFIVND